MRGVHELLISRAPDLLADDIAAALDASGGLTTEELAGRLAVPERDVTRQLFAGHSRFRCDRGNPPRWWLASDGSDRARAAAPARAPTDRRAPAAQHVPGAPALTDPACAPAPSTRASRRPRLYSWQSDALGAWESRRRRGVIEAVTGAGKTMVGIAATLDELDHRGQVLVLVPTVELLHQWVDQLDASVGPGCKVGRMGGGHADDLTTHDVVVAVVNSARALDVRPIRRGGLLVADECHRYGSAVNRLALDVRFTSRLGLSATYAREDDGTLTWLDPYFGGTCFRLGYRRAIADGVTARFSVTLAGVRLSSAERTVYDELSGRMAALRKRLVRRCGVPSEPFEAFLRAVMALAESAGPGSGVARSFRQTMIERRRLLADTPAKDRCLESMAPALAEAERAFVFTQSIAVAERAAARLEGLGLLAEALHSELSPDERRAALRRFATGEVRVLTAPRLLDEGIDVPAAEMAVIVGASRSRRQMIQRMGRVLRRKPGGRVARFGVVFVEGTVEDPRAGAHEAFLEEVVDVADRVTLFDASAVWEHPELVVASLQRGAATSGEEGGPSGLAIDTPLG